VRTVPSIHFPAADGKVAVPIETSNIGFCDKGIDFLPEEDIIITFGKA